MCDLVTRSPCTELLSVNSASKLETSVSPCSSGRMGASTVRASSPAQSTEYANVDMD